MTAISDTHVKRSAHDRIVESAYGLFSRRGVRDVAVDEIIRNSGVAIATFYRHFPSKNDVVLAFLERREQVWTLGTVETEARHRGATGEERLLAIFDVFEEWFRQEDFESCSFVNVLLEMGPHHPAGQASIAYLANIRDIIRCFAEEAGLEGVEDFVWSWHLLMKGSIITTLEGDSEAAARAKRMGAVLIAEHSSHQ